MLQRETLVLAKHMYHGPRKLRLLLERSMAAATKPSTSTRQLWRNTRKKVGPTTSKAVVQDAEKELVNALRAEKNSSRAATSKLINDEELPEYNWVPPAYRGIIDEIKPGNSVRRHRLESIQAKGMVRPRRLDKPKTDRYILYSKDWAVDVPVVGLPEQAVIAKQRKEESMMNDVLAFTKAAASYRSHLSDSKVTDLDENEIEPSMTLSSTSFQQQIASTIQSLHDNVTINSKRIDDSDADFLSLCQILKQLCSSAFHLSTLRKYNDQDASVYVDLAEFTLLGLVQINHDRVSLVGKYNSDSKEIAKNQSESKSQTSVTGWFNQIVEGLTPSLLSKKTERKEAESVENDTALTLKEIPYDASMLESMKRLLRNVMGIIASTGKEPEIPLVAHPKVGNEMNGVTVNDDALSQRMTALLEKTWRLGVRDIEATQKVMDVVARMGTLESARLCHEIYQKFASEDRHVSIIVVFEGYLEAIKRETDQSKVHGIFEEVMNIHDISPWSSHRLERILQAATVLKCLAAADMGKVDGMCARAELIVRRMLREKNFLYFVGQVESDDPGVECALVPVANYLGQLYATSGEPQLEAKSVKLLKYAITDCCDGFNALTIYPTADACNAVLQILAKSAGEKESSLVNTDYKFARKVLKLMFKKAEMGSAPNQTTYDCMFSLLEAVDASNIGAHGEELLSYIETSNLLYHSSTFSLPYRTYYRVLHYYLKTAKDYTPSMEIDEKNVPYRRAAHLLRKLEIRSTPMVLHNNALDEIAVKNLYSPRLRPYHQAYELVMQICANTAQSQYQDEAADVAIEIYRTRFQYDSKMADCWETVLENCSNEKLVERVKALKEQKM